MGISGDKKARYTEDERSASNLNVDGLDAEGYYACLIQNKKIRELLKNNR